MAAAGDIVVVDFPGVHGVKRRPAVVFSSDEYHRSRPDVIVGLITSRIADANAASDHVLVDWRSAGLHKASAFRTFIITLPRTSITAAIGHVSAADWQAIRNCVDVAMAP